jgi:ATP-dependent DNA helicase RecG
MAIEIKTDVQYIKGVGPKLGAVLSKRGIYTVQDLLEWYPRTYEDRRAARAIASLEAGQVVSVRARVLSVRSMSLGRSRRKMYEVVVGDSSGRIACKYFRVPYRGYFERFESGLEVQISGKVIYYRNKKEFHHPDIHPVRDDENSEDQLIPLYTDTEGLSPSKLRKIIDTALKSLPNEAVSAPPVKKNDLVYRSPEGVKENLPQWLLEKYQLVPKLQSMLEIHQPPLDQAELFLKFRSPAQRRVIFEEFFKLEFLLAFRKQGLQKEQSHAFRGNNSLIPQFLKSLPFELTQAQHRSFAEVKADLEKPHPMHRLVQGDVGSGKTIVALLGALYAIESGYQAAIMVPTEILAEQHYRNALQLLDPLGVKVCLLTGTIKPKERESIGDDIRSGRCQLIVGTHALIQEDVAFHNLGLVIIDEQHRFGVEQRNKLKAKGKSPHFLIMTATPIPRTLAMTVYGDLDVSIIDELPKGRQPIVTRKTFESKRDKVFGFVEEQVKKGRQAYVVYPLVEESEKLDLKNAEEEFEKIKARFPAFRVGLLHGKMKSSEKDAIMRDFRDNKIHILVATTVIEVGVDVPNANIMVIEHAERFGLSQLHQLRGRVGRGEHKSYCILVLGYAVSDEAGKRAEIMEETTDGFKIAEADLEMRGPGEFLGRRQSGLPGFKMANLVRDVLILQEARQAAFEVVHKDPELKSLQNQHLQSLIDSPVLG